MKIIISHDVDHLFCRDHWFRDLFYPKLWIRSLQQAIRKDITWNECRLRMASCFQKEIHRIAQVMDFDREHGVPSTFFFGMNQGLGMSYFPEEAKQTIRRVHDKGFDVGVHGIVFDNEMRIRTEYETFVQTMGFEPCGIRMHYVRTDAKTFAYEERAGYAFDSSLFDKKNGGTVKDPFQVGRMWEFPLAIMDGYLPKTFEGAKQETIKKIEKCREANMEYVSILFHDYQFDDAYSNARAWYSWLIRYIEESKRDSFISFREAIQELEEKR